MFTLKTLTDKLFVEPVAFTNILSKAEVIVEPFVTEDKLNCNKGRSLVLLAAKPTLSVSTASPKFELGNCSLK